MLHITGWLVLLHTVTYSYIPYVIAIDNKDNKWCYKISYCDKTGKSDKSVNTSCSIYELSVNVLTGNIKFGKQHKILKTTSNFENNIKFEKTALNFENIMITIGNFVMPNKGLLTVIGAIFVLLSLAIDFSFGKLKTLI